MNEIEEYDLFLFDFDGLLVDTELLHFFAYKAMCKNHGFDLNWSFEKYIRIAHYHSQGLEQLIYAEFPSLKDIQPDWSILYREKKAALIKIYVEDHISLMPGVERFLSLLNENKKKMAVVTNSDQDLIQIIKNKIPILATIPNWITRELYDKAKPNPECYLKTIEMLAEDKDKVIGFEDTPRGLKALMGTRAKPIIITEINYPELPSLIQSGVLHFPSFEYLIEAHALGT